MNKNKKNSRTLALYFLSFFIHSSTLIAAHDSSNNETSMGRLIEFAGQIAHNSNETKENRKSSPTSVKTQCPICNAPSSTIKETDPFEAKKCKVMARKCDAMEIELHEEDFLRFHKNYRDAQGPCVITVLDEDCTLVIHERVFEALRKQP